MRLKILVFLVLVTSLKSLAQNALIQSKVERGITETLANYRKHVLSTINYDLTFHIPAEKQQLIDATETISVNISSNNFPLQIDFKEQRNHIKSIQVNKQPIAIVFANEHIVIDHTFLKEGSNKIAIAFTAGDLSLNRDKDFLYTLLVPDRARTVFPCFDQPDLKATFNLTLNIPVAWEALSNAPLLDSLITESSKTYRYASSDTISTYLFSFVAGNFSHIYNTVNGKTMNFLHRETDTNKINFSVDSIFKIHRDALNFLEQYTQIKYPFKKLDFVAIPDFQYGGMEHVGAIDYKAASLFLDSGATKDQENARANLIAHETAHMWFGDLVTMKWFNDVWMKEVFANFMADKVGQVSQASNNYELKFLIDHFPAAYGVDRTLGANPIRQPLSNLQEAGTLYGNIIYHKAPVMMRQLERLMGKDAFRDGLREYLQRYKFSNANWTDLITILSAHTKTDLNSWNKVWVEKPGRPVISYHLTQHGNVISSLIINQKGEHASKYILPQFFEVALVYAHKIEEITVHLDKQHVLLKEAEGKPLPDYILFNSSGQGYGIFPVDKKMFRHITDLKNPVMRASAYINLYENMLSAKDITPLQLMRLYETLLSKETEELNVRLITNHITDIFWRLTTPVKRVALAAELEKTLWKSMQDQTTANKKKILFKTFQSIALSQPAKDTLYHIFKLQKPPVGVKLTEEDYTSLALALAVRDYPQPNLLEEQLSRIKNIDRKNRLSFLMPALSPDVAKRDAFFMSLKIEKNREKEAWVTTALDYLHHPLRASTSKKYLLQSLELLKEIQSTGDIFFPGAWLQSTFGNYQTTEAANVVRVFLQKNCSYNLKLKAKILQATDALFRAEKLLSKK